MVRRFLFSSNAEFLFTGFPDKLIDFEKFPINLKINFNNYVVTQYIVIN